MSSYENISAVVLSLNKNPNSFATPYVTEAAVCIPPV